MEEKKCTCFPCENHQNELLSKCYKRACSKLHKSVRVLAWLVAALKIINLTLLQKKTYRAILKESFMQKNNKNKNKHMIYVFFLSTIDFIRPLKLNSQNSIIKRLYKSFIFKDAEYLLSKQ